MTLCTLIRYTKTTVLPFRAGHYLSDQLDLFSVLIMNTTSLWVAYNYMVTTDGHCNISDDRQKSIVILQGLHCLRGYAVESAGAARLNLLHNVTPR